MCTALTLILVSCLHCAPCLPPSTPSFLPSPAVRSEDVIRKTASRLSAADAGAFLKAAVARLQSAPGRGEQLASWIRAVLLAHAGSLVAQAGMQVRAGTGRGGAVVVCAGRDCGSGARNMQQCWGGA